MASSGPKNPYVGLRPFQMDESLLFFGREDQTLELLQRLHKHSFVAVVGSSGSGKSSLLRAGLIPALMGGFLVENSDKWMIATMKPGQRPLYNLAEAILSQINSKAKSKDVVALVNKIESQGASAILDLVTDLRKDDNFNFFLLIDQFEELFRFSMESGEIDKMNEAIDFVNTFLELVSQNSIPFYVVLTMRSDFIGDCAQFHGLPEAMNKSQYLVPRLSREQLKKVIEGPAKLYGGVFDSALTSRLLNHIGKVTDELPVLQHALMRMWDYEVSINKSGAIDLEDYKSIGGVKQALSVHADEALDELNKQEKQIAEQLFKSLTEIDDYGRKIRRPARLSELMELTGADADTILGIIDHFIRDNRSFLIVQNIGDSDDKLIDISHESLIRQWSLLEKWVDEEGENAKIYAKLINAKKEYDSEYKGLLDDLELQNFVEWRDHFNITENWANRYGDGFKDCMLFLTASEKAQLQRQKDERRRANRMKIFMGSTVVLLIACIVIGLILARLQYVAYQEDLADRLHEKAQELLKKNPTTALMLEMEAFKIGKLQKYQDWATTIYNGDYSFYKIENKLEPFVLDNALQKGTSEIQDTYIAPTNDRAVVHYKSGALVIFYPNSSGTVLREGKKQNTNISGDAPKSGGATKNDEEMKVSQVGITALEFSQDGTQLVFAEDNGRISLWSELTDVVTVVRDGDQNYPAVRSIAFSNNGREFVTGGSNGNISVWSSAGDLLYNKAFSPNFPAAVNLLKYSLNDSLIFGSSYSFSTVFNKEISTELIPDVSAYGDYDELGIINAVAFDTIGNFIVTGGQDKKIRIWDAEGRLSRFFEGHTEEVNFVDFLYWNNRTYIVSAAKDHAIILWNLDGTPFQRFVGHEGDIIAVRLSQDGKSIISKSLDLTTRKWTLKEPLLPLLDHNPFDYILAVGFTKDGKGILTAADSYSIKQWDRNGNFEDELLATDEDGLDKYLENIILSQNGELAIMSVDGEILLKKLKGDILYNYQGNYIHNAAFSTDGSKLALLLTTGEVAVQDTQTQKIDTIFNHSVDADIFYSVNFSPDNKKIVLGTDTGYIWVMKLDGTINRKIEVGDGFVSNVTFSPDGKTIFEASVKMDTTTDGIEELNPEVVAKMYTLEGEFRSKFEGHTGFISVAAFAPDGKSLITGSGDFSAILWDLEGKIIKRFIRHSDMITSVAFSPDGSLIVTGSFDGKAYLWNTLPQQSLEDFLNSGNIEPLSQVLRVEYGID